MVVNVHNISCDLHMEHLNRLVTEGLGANKSEKAIKRVGKAIGVMKAATHSYDKELGIQEPSGRHSDAAWKGDMEK